MTISPSIYARDTIIAAMKAAPSVTAFIPASRIYPAKVPNKPTFPFARSGPAEAVPATYSGWSGGEVSGAIHTFVKVSNTLPDGETFCGRAVEAMASVMHDLDHCFVDRTLTQQDGEEADVWHGIVFYRFDAAEPLP